MSEFNLFSGKYLLLFLLPCCLVPSFLSARHIIPEDQEVPSFNLKDLKGVSFSSELLKNKIGVIVFARPGQKRSTEALKSLMKIGAGVSKTSVRFIFIFSGDISKSSIEELCKTVKLQGKILLDPDMSVYGKFGVIVTPSLVIRGRNKKVLFSKAGYDFEFERVLNINLRYALGLVTKESRNKLISEERNPISFSRKIARFLGMAKKLRKQGQYDSAEKIIKKIIIDAKNSPEIFLEYAKILLALKKPGEALKVLKKVSKKDLSSTFKLVEARCLLAQGKFNEAEKEFKTAIKLAPKNAMAHYELGKIYDKQGKKDQAIKELKLAFEKLLGENQ